MQSLLSEVNAAFWEHSRVRNVYRNTLMTDFARAFQNDHHNTSDAVEYDVVAQKCQPGQEQDFATCEGKCAAYMWVSE